MLKLQLVSEHRIIAEIPMPTACIAENTYEHVTCNDITLPGFGLDGKSRANSLKNLNRCTALWVQR